MLSRALLACCFLLPLSQTKEVAASASLASGLVTRVDPAGSFDLEGTPVRVMPGAVFTLERNGIVTTIPDPGQPSLGQLIDIEATYDKKTNTILGSRFRLIAPSPVHITGSAIIDQAPGTKGAACTQTVRADGYQLCFTPQTQVTVAPPLTSGQSLGTNLWIDYEGMNQGDGTVILSTASVRNNTVSHFEDSLRTKKEYDPKAVDPNVKQGSFSQHLTGTDYKKLPPHINDALQAKIERIGRSLVPPYQRDLPETDPTKISFRFEVIDSDKLRHAVALPSGIILFPYLGFSRMENDSEIAAILANSIAEVIEKRNYRHVPTDAKLTAANLAGGIGGLFVPGLGLASTLATDRINKHVLSREEEQSGRVSLFLLHDAGYDLTQAPLSWWLLAPKQPQPITNTRVPVEASNLYLALGTTWQKALQSPSTHPASVQADQKSKDR